MKKILGFALAATVIILVLHFVDVGLGSLGVGKIKTAEAKTHSYVVENEGEYGYQGEVSKNDKDAGVSQAPLIMFQYLGSSEGEFLVSSDEGGQRSYISCKMPCKFIKISSISPEYVALVESLKPGASKPKIIPGDGTIAQAALLDAANGVLIPYSEYEKKLQKASAEKSAAAAEAAKQVKPMAVDAGDPTKQAADQAKQVVDQAKKVDDNAAAEGQDAGYDENGQKIIKN